MSKTGSCLCGAVKYEVTGDLRPIVACHCKQCRKQSGHFFAATNSADEHLHINDEKGALKWFRASDFARRGFCSECGSVLFWKSKNDDFTSILAGSIDGETGLEIAQHIYVADKGDYYEITDGKPQDIEQRDNRPGGAPNQS